MTTTVGPALIPAWKEAAKYLKARSARAARQGMGWDNRDIEEVRLLIAALELLCPDLASAPPPAGEGP